MIVPGDNNPLKRSGRTLGETPGRPAGNVVPMQRPSEAQLLMALAEMHRQGQFKTAQTSDDYAAAYEELQNAPEGSRSVSDTAKMLRGKSGVPFPDWGKEENEAFIEKYGPEKAIDVLNARIGMIQKNIDRHSSKGTSQGDMDASISKDYLDRLNEMKKKILSDQGS